MTVDLLQEVTLNLLAEVIESVGPKMKMPIAGADRAVLVPPGTTGRPRILRALQQRPTLSIAPNNPFRR